MDDTYLDWNTYKVLTSPSKVRGLFLLLGFSLFHIVEFLNRETKLWETNKPPAMQVSQHCFSLQ